MSPQFVDFNADGHTDIVAATFSGSPYVALGDGEGFHQPEQILDKEGERIVLNQFWNYDDKKWDDTSRCDPIDGARGKKGHLTSAWAMDWDHDGDLDLLLGDYADGRLYLRMNEGDRQQPSFATHNVVVEAGGEPIKVDKTATMRVIDWTGDGVDDLLLGSIGDSYGDGTGQGGGVFLYRGRGADGATAFEAPVALVETGPIGGGHEPTRPDAGLYMDAADHDGDGDLDLVVGGYSL